MAREEDWLFCGGAAAVVTLRGPMGRQQGSAQLAKAACRPEPAAAEPCSSASMGAGLDCARGQLRVWRDTGGLIVQKELGSGTYVAGGSAGT